ncbi:MAG TPA: hypothetical protein VIX17_11635 [Pyrinomonadaceae bacterium]|jgi:hypothetical protein
MPEQQAKRCVIEYRTKELKEGAKWSLWFQREIDAIDSQDAMKQFYSRPLWPAMTGNVEVKRVIWID